MSSFVASSSLGITPASGTATADALHRLAASLTAVIQPADTTYSYPAPGVAAPRVATLPSQLAGLGCPALTDAPAARTDCSGWVSWLLAAAAPEHYAGALAFRERGFAQDPCPWPRANVWYQYFLDASSRGLFEVVAPFSSLLPGNVLVWALDPFAASTSYLEAPGDTGHVMVVLAPDAPIRQAVAPPAGTTAAHVAVSDSSCVPHASGGLYADARLYGTGPACGSTDRPGGVGAGVITFAVDASGRATAFCFDATDAANHFHPPGTDQFGNPALLVARPL